MLAKNTLYNGLRARIKNIDITIPGKKPDIGHLHPLTIIRRQIEDIFFSMGFSVIEGNEIETEYYNFDALNIPETHPARDDWDTFYLEDKRVLRTHTSPMQIHYMENHTPPLRIVAPGTCFRNERTDATHDFQFMQIEGLFIDKNIGVQHFKAVMHEFFKKLFDKNIQMRLRPGFFPFTEPSFEVDIKQTKTNNWLEIMGAGMVHPYVLKAVKYPAGKWSGFAFGIGLERVAMVKWGIDDIRLFRSGDLRFVKQF